MHSLKINKCSTSCNNANDPYENLRVTYAVKNKFQSI